jgi:hypothetical protein
LKRTLHVGRHLVGGKNAQLVTMGGESEMRIGMAAQCEGGVRGYPAGKVGVSLYPLAGQEERGGRVSTLQFIDHPDVGVGANLAGV